MKKCIAIIILICSSIIQAKAADTVTIKLLNSESVEVLSLDEEQVHFDSTKIIIEEKLYRILISKLDTQSLLLGILVIGNGKQQYSIPIKSLYSSDIPIEEPYIYIFQNDRSGEKGISVYCDSEKAHSIYDRIVRLTAKSNFKKP